MERWQTFIGLTIFIVLILGCGPAAKEVRVNGVSFQCHLLLEVWADKRTDGTIGAAIPELTMMVVSDYMADEAWRTTGEYVEFSIEEASDALVYCRKAIG